MRRISVIFFCIIVPLSTASLAGAAHPQAHVWSDGQKAILQSLWIESLPPVPDDPSNRYDTDNRAASLGKKLFLDSRLSANGKVACATCHIPDKTFTDTLPIAHGMADTTRRSMPLAGSAYSPFLFWDGRADSLWAQALGPIESPAEHGISRTRVARIISTYYKTEYEEIFGPVPMLPEGIAEQARPAADNAAIQAAWIALPQEQREEITRLYVNVGKAIAAFVRTITPAPSRFDNYVAALVKNDTKTMRKQLTEEEALGLKLFIGRAGCINCHNGPLFTNNGFHNVGIPQPEGLAPDPGRAEGIIKVLTSEFNCTSGNSDATPEDCLELRYIDTETTKYIMAFKTPSLRNVADRPPYMHAGQFKTLREVLQFYQKTALKRASGAQQGTLDISHGTITDDEMYLLEKFLHTLSGPIMALQ